MDYNLQIDIINTRVNTYFNPLYVELIIVDILNDIKNVCNYKLFELEKKQTELSYGNIKINIDFLEKENVSKLLTNYKHTIQFSFTEENYEQS